MTVALAGLDELLGYRHSSVMLLDEEGARLFTIASHGYPAEGVGSEVEVGDGIAGQLRPGARRCASGTSARCRSTRGQCGARSNARATSDPERDVPLPTLADTQSRIAVPAMVRGELVGVLVVDSPLPVAFDDDDEAVLTVRRHAHRPDDRHRPNGNGACGRLAADGSPWTVRHLQWRQRPDDEVHVRFFAVDGSVFLDGDYLIRGVAGRILWSLVQRHQRPARPSSPTRSCASTRRWSCPVSATTSTPGWYAQAPPRRTRRRRCASSAPVVAGSSCDVRSCCAWSCTTEGASPGCRPLRELRPHSRRGSWPQSRGRSSRATP